MFSDLCKYKLLKFFESNISAFLLKIRPTVILHEFLPKFFHSKLENPFFASLLPFTLLIFSYNWVLMKLTQTSPVQYLFIRTQYTEFIPKWMAWCWIKLNRINKKWGFGNCNVQHDLMEQHILNTSAGKQLS